jgi:hypothetical protein
MTKGPSQAMLCLFSLTGLGVSRYTTFTNNVLSRLLWCEKSQGVPCPYNEVSYAIHGVWQSASGSGASAHQYSCWSRVCVPSPHRAAGSRACHAQHEPCSFLCVFSPRLCLYGYGCHIASTRDARLVPLPGAAYAAADGETYCPCFSSIYSSSP